MFNGDISIFIAFLAGLLSFLSPCVLPLVPAYLGHLVGVTATALPSTESDRLAVSSSGAAHYRAANPARLVALGHALMFVLGFSLVFITFWVSIGAFGQLLPGYVRYVRPLGGIVLIILGLNMTGLFKITFLYRNFKLWQGKPAGQAVVKSKLPGLPASFFTGVVFAAGWTPCIGPVLGAIIGLASESDTVLEGTYLLAAYSLGLGVPFVVCALALGQANGLLRRLNLRLNGVGLVSLVSGLLVVLIGVLMLTGAFQTLPQYFNWLPI